MATYKEKKGMLDSLIASQEELKGRNCLTEKGIDHLSGLKAARKLVFGDPNEQKLKKGKK